MNKPVKTYLFSEFLNKEGNKLQKEIKDFYIKKNSLTKMDFINQEKILKITAKEFKYYKEIGQKALEGKDITYDIGHVFFYDVEIDLTKKVFIPQPDTELLVEQVLNDYKTGNGLEIGTGTGAISIAIAKNTKITLDAIDVNTAAIKIAQRNAFNNEVGNGVNFIHKSFSSLKEKKYDFIVSNPPYIKKDDPHISHWVKANQPKKAIYSKKDGLAFIESILVEGKKFLKPKGKIYLEFGFEQKKPLEVLIKKYYQNFNFYKDLGNHWRVVVIENGKQTKNSKSSK